MYTCVHGKGDDKENELQHTYLGEPTHGVEKRSFDQHLRIHIHYDEPTISQLPASKSDLLKEVLIPAATGYFESVLRVRRLDVPVTLARTCIRKKSVLFRNDPRRYCQFGCNANTLCGSVVVPQRHLQACWISNGRAKVSVGQSGPGVNNTDYLLYVSAKLEGFCQQGAFAYASVCQLEATLDRPVVGFINICPDKFHLTLQSRAFLNYVIRHEITHGLGFLPNLFAFFRDGKGNPLTARHHITRRPPIVKGRYMASERVIRRIVRKSWKVKMGFISLGMTLLVTENVKREVRRHFGCSHLEGAELEDQDVSSGTGSHWEKRLFENEVMTASVSQNPVYSRITLALLQDTGWYDVDYEKADMLYWGRGLGCEFAMTSCMDYMERQHARNRSVLPYCDVVSGGGVIQSRCNPERNALVRCNLMKYTKNLPTRYQNFQNLSGVTSSDIGRCGGMITYADFCPYWTMFTRPTRHGKQMGSECSVADNQPDNNILLEHYGTHSICLHHSAMWCIHNGTTRLMPVYSGSGCYKVSLSMETVSENFQVSCFGK
ncbi:Leishmanolysin-like peptidase [Lamellibrachia satsuma]|nr:Leishmanolysin-like peptidase [Lamellibrachia satsuma]